MSIPNEKDLAPAVQKIAEGKWTDAVPLIAGLVGTQVLGPLGGAAATGAAKLIAERVADTANARLKKEWERVEAETALDLDTANHITRRKSEHARAAMITEYLTNALSPYYLDTLGQLTKLTATLDAADGCRREEFENLVRILRQQEHEGKCNEARSVLHLLRAKRVLFESLEHEIWSDVFGSLKAIRDELARFSGRANSHKKVQESIRAAIEGINTYLRIELDYREFMTGPQLSGLSGSHRERNWPSLGEAASNLLALRRALANALLPIAEIAADDEARTWLDQLAEPSQTLLHWIQYASARQLCTSCGWDTGHYPRPDCPTASSACPTFASSQTVFRYTAFNKISVQVAGSFSAWNPIALNQSPYGEWWIRLDVPRDIRQQYKFIVDGEWTLDPRTPVAESDSCGNVNSVLPTISADQKNDSQLGQLA